MDYSALVAVVQFGAPNEQPAANGSDFSTDQRDALGWMWLGAPRSPCKLMRDA